MRRFPQWPLLAVLALSGCSCVDVSGLEAACESDGTCSAGKVCCQGRCLDACSGDGGADGGADAGIDGGVDGGVDAGTCNPANCTGCCQGDVCQSGTQVGACGTAGAACVGCTGGALCQGGVCVSCDLSNCASGCCLSASCFASTPARCGADAGACVDCSSVGADDCLAGSCRCGTGPACGAGRQCLNGACTCTSTSCLPGTRCDLGQCVCDPTSCPSGCCQGGQCVGLSGQSPAQCGNGGAQCSSCASGETCTNGSCSGCSPSNCSSGCCTGSVCQAAPAPATCGIGGVSCLVCASEKSDACTNGVCRCGTTAACGSGQRCLGGSCVCDGTSCPNGCCENNQCVGTGAQSAAKCGNGGAACANCPSATADSCTAGACTCGVGASCGTGLTCAAPADGGLADCECTALSCVGANCCKGDACIAQIGTDGGVRCREANGLCLPECLTATANACSATGACRCGLNPACGAGQRCTGTSCSCDAVSCPNGCCQGSQCVTVETNRCRLGPSATCAICAGSADNCVPGPDGCRCGTGTSCGGGTTCQNGKCVCNAFSLCNGCCSGNDSCLSPTAGTCGESGSTCQACAQTCGFGKCSGCPAPCDGGCCLGDACAPIDAGTTYPFCRATNTSPSCETCDPNRSDRCAPTFLACACGTDIQCVLGDRCVGGICECDPSTCRGCCDRQAGGNSTCVGTVTVAACANPPVTGGMAPNCFSCLDGGTVLADRCVAGSCRCGAEPACDGGTRCTTLGCVP